MPVGLAGISIKRCIIILYSNSIVCGVRSNHYLVCTYAPRSFLGLPIILAKRLSSSARQARISWRVYIVYVYGDNTDNTKHFSDSYQTVLLLLPSAVISCARNIVIERCSSLVAPLTDRAVCAPWSSVSSSPPLPPQCRPSVATRKELVTSRRHHHRHHLTDGSVSPTAVAATATIGSIGIMVALDVRKNVQ